jgi:hypothetical protein
MRQPNTIKELIDLWATRKDLADDISFLGDAVTVERVHKWAQSGAIPARYHLAVISAAERRGFPVCALDLAVLHATDRGRAA